MMRPYRTLRLACQSRPSLVVPKPSWVPIPNRSCYVARRLQHSLTDKSKPKKLPQDSSAESTSARFAGTSIVDGEASEFKKQRKTDLARDRESENPVFAESYPRLKADPDRMSIGDFKKRFQAVGANAASQRNKEPTVTKVPDPSLTSDPDRAVPEDVEARFQQAHKEVTVQKATLTGRIRAKRVVSKGLVFVDIVNDFHKVQVMISAKKCLPQDMRRNFALWRNLVQVGDHISVTGTSTITKAGELTLEAEALPELLSPTMEQIPDKLVDPRTKMQERHLDMLVNKEVTDILRLRASITKHLRDHFHSKKFLEMQTPILADNAGGAIARPFKTRATEFQDKELALRIAPELWLKRLVVGGIDKVFEIGPAFRNEGIDGTHNPEFTTCEFYSAYSNLGDLIKQTEEILHGMAAACQALIATDLTALPPIDVSRFEGPFKQVEFVPGLEEAMGIRLPNLSSDDALPELLAVLKLGGVAIPGETPTSLPKLLDRLAAIYLEPMSFHEPLFIINHPVSMSPLAKGFLCPATYQLVSARAELFAGGRELANMYEEENDPEEQERKMSMHRSLVNKPNGEIGIKSQAEKSEADAAAAEAAAAEEVVEEIDDEVPPIDQAYIRALEYGLPPTGGWGCGVERLVMLFSGSDRISDCLSFGTLRNVVGRPGEEKSKSM